MPKKVLHVITNYSALGGAEMMLQKLVLAQPEFDHYIISLIEISDIYKDSLSKVVYYKALGWRIKNTLKTIKKLKDEINKIQPDIIQSWMYHANFMAIIANRCSKVRSPVYWGIHHSLNLISEESLSTKIAIYISRLLSKSAEGIIYCAQSSLEQHQAFGFQNTKQVFIPNGIDLNKFRFVERTFELPIRIGFVGRFHKAKGIPCLFEVMSNFNNDSNVLFKIAGQGLTLENDKIRELFEKNNIGQNVQLLGSVRQMEDFYHGIDVLLMTSITEGFPNVLIEAMATGAVCISTDVGDAFNIIGLKENITEISDTKGLVTILENYFNEDVFNKKSLSVSFRSKVVENYSLQYVAKKYSQMWNMNLA